MDEFEHNRKHDPTSPGDPPNRAGLRGRSDQHADSEALASGRLLTAAQVAQLLTLKESWVREQTRRGLIPHLRLGRYTRYRYETIIAWISQQERQAR